MTEGDTAFVRAVVDRARRRRTTYDEAYDRLVLDRALLAHWLDRGEFPDHPWRTYLQRSALTLKGLTYAPTGALIAAAHDVAARDAAGRAQLGLPLHLDPRRHVHALGPLHARLRLGGQRLLLLRRRRGRGGESELQIMYGIGGERELTEKTLDHLSGYEGARPVRIGNGAYDQRQHDVWGAVLDSVYLHTKSRDHLPERVWPILKRQVERAIEHWREPDRGIWEVRGEPQHFTSSKVMCWVALDRGARLARMREEPELADALAGRRPTRSTRTSATNGARRPRRVHASTTTTDALDASVLLMPLVRFLPPDDPRIRATVLAIADELTEDGLVLRYRVEETDDGLAGEEGTFTICSFWLVSALAEIGEHRRGARAVREAAVATPARCSSTPRRSTRAPAGTSGNFPQAFTHLALINAVMHVIRAEEQAVARPHTGVTAEQIADAEQGRGGDPPDASPAKG